MGTVSFLRDRLVNLMTGAGTTNDARAYGFYALQRMTPHQIEASYRSSWLMRNAVDIPAYDMTRAWRDWQAKKEQIEAIESEERRLGLREKVRRALILARLGGGALVLGTRDADPMQPLADKPSTGALVYLHVMSRHQLTLGAQIMDPADPLFGQPAWFELSGSGRQVRIHPSRVIAFRGLQVPDLGTAQFADWFWGDPIGQSIADAVANADLAQSGFASLITKARLDVIKMPNLMAQAATPEYEKRFMERMRLAGLGASTHQALVLDAEEDWDQRQVNWAGMPEIIKTYLSIVAGATGIPATRLLGKAPDGMNATGEGDERNYNTMIAGRQENDLRPLLERIDAVMLPALGITDPDVGFEFAPLSVLSEKERADIAKTKAETTQIYVGTGLLPELALEKGVQNQLVEDGTYPGLDGALAELPEDERFLSQGEDNTAERGDPNDLEAGGADGSGAAQPALKPTIRRAANDAIKRVMQDHHLTADDRAAFAMEVGDKPPPPFADGKKGRHGARGGNSHYVETAHPRGLGGRWTNKNAQVQEHVTRALGSGKEHSTTSLGPVSSANAAKVREQTGVDISGHERVLHSGDIRHAMNSHADPAIEAARGQVAIKKADFQRIPEIVEAANAVKADGSKQSRRGLRLTYTANIDGHEYTYTELVQSNRLVALKSMRKK